MELVEMKGGVTQSMDREDWRILGIGVCLLCFLVS